MKTILLFAAAMALAGGVRASNPAMDDLAAMGGGGASDVARDHVLYPALPYESPEDTEARRVILKLIDKLKAAGQLTPEIEAQLTLQLAKIQAAAAARRAEAATPKKVIVQFE